MPAKNLGQIRTRAKELILDIDTISDDMIDNWIQDGQEELEDRHGFRVMEAELSVNTTAATRKLGDIPSDWCRERSKPRYVNASSKTKPMDWILDAEELDKLYHLDDTDDDGAPAHIRVNEADDELDIYPLPDGNGPVANEYPVRVPYFKRLATLTTADDDATNWFTQNGAKYLEYYAAAEGADFNRDREAEVTFKAQAEAAAQRLIKREKKKAAMRTTVMRPRRDVLAPASQARMS